MLVRFIIGILICSLFIFVSCEADINLNDVSKEISLKPSLVVPLGSASVTLWQILTQNNTSGKFIMGDKVIYFIVSTDSVIIKPGVLNLLDYSTELPRKIFPSPDKVYIVKPNTGFEINNIEDTLKLGINSNPTVQRIDSVNVSSATLSIQVDVTDDLKSIRPNDLALTLIFPKGQMRKQDGTSNSISFTPKEFGQVGEIPITNFVMNTSGDATGIPITLDIKVKTSASPLTLGPNSKISCKIKISQLNFAVAYGYFESNVISSKTLKQKLDINKNFPNELLKFINPQIDIRVISNIGTYLQFKVDYVKAYLSTDKTVAPVFATFDGLGSTIEKFDIKPPIPNSFVSKDLRTINNKWGETNILFSNVNNPDVLEYNFSAFIDNFKEEQDPKPAFITPDACIKVYTTTSIPLQFSSGSYYEHTDSIDNIFEQIANAFDKFKVTSVDSTFLILNIKNGLPVKTILTLKMLDLQGNELDTNFQRSYTINAGKVDAEGIVKPGQELQTLTISLAKEELEEIRKAQTIAYTVRIEGGDVNSNIRFTQSNNFDIHAGLYFMGSLKTGLGE